MTTILKRLRCRIFGHLEYKVIDKMELRSVSPFSGPMFDIKKSHMECFRCPAKW